MSDDQQDLTAADVQPIPDAAGEVQPGEEDTGPHSSGDDEMGAAHGDPDWIPRFVSWAREETDTLDFDGADVPQRVQDLLQHYASKPSTQSGVNQ